MFPRSPRLDALSLILGLTGPAMLPLEPIRAHAFVPLKGGGFKPGGRRNSRDTDKGDRGKLNRLKKRRNRNGRRIKRKASQLAKAW